MPHLIAFRLCIITFFSAPYFNRLFAEIFIFHRRTLCVGIINAFDSIVSFHFIYIIHFDRMHSVHLQRVSVPLIKPSDEYMLLGDFNMMLLSRFPFVHSFFALLSMRRNYFRIFHFFIKLNICLLT